MIVSEEHIKQALKGETESVKALKTEHELLSMHVYGKNKTKYLTKITGLENDEQLKLRQKYGRSNKDIISNLTAPVNKIFSAKGKNKTYNFKQKETSEKFRRYLSTVDNGKSLENWLSSYWKEKITCDPNGLFMIEYSATKEPYPTYKSILSIRDYKQVGQKVEYIIFEPYKKEVNGNILTFCRVYDDEADKLYLVDGDRISLIKEQTFKNTWGYVPAVVISDIEDTNSDFKKSSIDNEVELANEYLLGNSNKAIYKFKIGFPLFWMYLSSCPVCKGEGEIEGKECKSCNGSGHALKKDISDITGVKPPQTTDDVVITPDIAGYVTPPNEGLDQMTNELTLLRTLMEFSHWGTTQEKGENETATGRFIDIQPVSDKLDKYKISLETVETILVKFIADKLYPEIFEGSSINYGNRYMIETADQLLDKYSEGKTKKLPSTTLDYLLEQYYQGQFANDSMRLSYYVKLMKLEPWVHLTLGEIPELYKATEDYTKKVYFSEWVNSMKVDDIIMLDLTKLNKKLTEFINLKPKQNELPDKRTAADLQ